MASLSKPSAAIDFLLSTYYSLVFAFLFCQRTTEMAFAFEKLLVYQKTVDFADEILLIIAFSKTASATVPAE